MYAWLMVLFVDWSMAGVNDWWFDWFICCSIDRFGCLFDCLIDTLVCWFVA